jgi:hypothetical protein
MDSDINAGFGMRVISRRPAILTMTTVFSTIVIFPAAASMARKNTANSR